MISVRADPIITAADDKPGTFVQLLVGWEVQGEVFMLDELLVPSSSLVGMFAHYIYFPCMLMKKSLN